MGTLAWPEEVREYLRRRGKDPDGTCERSEEQARRQAEALMPATVIMHPRPRSMLDVGCGLAALPAVLAVKLDLVRVHLMDGDGTLNKDGGFKPVMAAWADVEMGAAVMRANTEVFCNVMTHRPDTRFYIPVDMILSSRSWGHHYPAHTYAAAAKRSLNAGGLLVLDIRNGSGGVRELEAAGFTVMCTVPDRSQKCVRFVFQHSIGSQP